MASSASPIRDDGRVNAYVIAVLRVGPMLLTEVAINLRLQRDTLPLPRSRVHTAEIPFAGFHARLRVVQGAKPIRHVTSLAVTVVNFAAIHRLHLCERAPSFGGIAKRYFAGRNLSRIRFEE